MAEAYICDYVRTPIGRFGGALASVRADDLGAVPLKSLMERHAGFDWGSVDEVIFGCANQAGEDNRNVARMSLLLAGLPDCVPGTTINRLCGSGMDALITACPRHQSRAKSTSPSPVASKACLARRSSSRRPKMPTPVTAKYTTRPSVGA